jgi:hypothetical protein
MRRSAARECVLLGEGDCLSADIALALSALCLQCRLLRAARGSRSRR